MAHLLGASRAADPAEGELEAQAADLAEGELEAIRREGREEKKLLQATLQTASVL